MWSRPCCRGWWDFVVLIASCEPLNLIPLSPPPRLLACGVGGGGIFFECRALAAACRPIWLPLACFPTWLPPRVRPGPPFAPWVVWSAAGRPSSPHAGCPASWANQVPSGGQRPMSEAQHPAMGTCQAGSCTASNAAQSMHTEGHCLAWAPMVHGRGRSTRFAHNVFCG